MGCGTGSLSLPADSPDGGPSVERDYSLEGPWTLPEDIAATTDGMFVSYDGAPPWDDGVNCTGSFAPGAQDLADTLMAEFPQIADISGYSCRPNTANASKLSIHGTGRAIDVFIRKRGDQADNHLGDPVANWLLLNAEALDVQMVIWDRSVWNGSSDAPKHGPYTGPHPHDDHLHVEVNLDGAQ